MARVSKHRKPTRIGKLVLGNREKRRQLIAKHKGLCAICGCQVSMREGDPKFATCDHIIPVSKGGPDVPSNWQLACYECNQAKGDTCASESSY